MKLKKINFIFVYILSILIIFLWLFLPLFKAVDVSDETRHYLIFGYHFLTGYLVPSTTNLDNSFLITSSWTAMIPILFPITIIIFEKAIEKGLGRAFFDFVIASGEFVFIFLLQLYTYKYMDNQSIFYGHIEFNVVVGYIILIIFASIYMIYFLINFILELIKVKREEKNAKIEEIYFMKNNKDEENNI